MRLRQKSDPKARGSARKHYYVIWGNPDTLSARASRGPGQHLALQSLASLGEPAVWALRRTEEESGGLGGWPFQNVGGEACHPTVWSPGPPGLPFNR